MGYNYDAIEASAEAMLEDHPLAAYNADDALTHAESLDQLAEPPTDDVSSELTKAGLHPRNTPIDVLMSASCGTGLCVAEVMENEHDYCGTPGS